MLYDQSSGSEPAYKPPGQPSQLAGSGAVRVLRDIWPTFPPTEQAKSGTTNAKKRGLIGKYSNSKTIPRFQHQALPTSTKYTQNGRYAPVVGAS
jgi:hypothetical protein